MRLHSTFRKAKRATSAFTLIEMMTVLVLIAIVTAMIVPEMKGSFEDALLRSTGRDLINVIELASSRAVSLNQTVRVNLDIPSGRYQIERLSHQGILEDFTPLDGVSGASGQLDKRIAVEIRPLEESPSPATGGNEVQIESEPPSLTFHSDGTADGAMILLKDRAGFRLGLRVNPVTSRVTISEPAHE